MNRPFDVPARMRTAWRECLMRRFVVEGVIAMVGMGMENGLWIGGG